MSTPNLEHNDHINFNEEDLEGTVKANSRQVALAAENKTPLNIFAYLLNNSTNNSDKLNNNIKAITLDHSKFPDLLKKITFINKDTKKPEAEEKNSQLLDEVKLLCQMTMLIPEEERNNASKDFLLFFKKLDTKGDFSTISEQAYQVLLSIPSEQRAKILTMASSVVKDTDSGDQRFLLLKTLAAIPSNELKDFFDLVWPNITRIKDSTECLHIFKALISIPKDLRDETFHIISPHIKDLAAASKNIDEAYQRLIAFALDSKELARFTRPPQREELCKLAWPLIAKLNPTIPLPDLTLPYTAYSISKLIINILYEIEPKKREDFCQKLHPLVKNMADAAEYASFFDCLSQFPAEERIEALKNMPPLGASIYPNLAEILSLIPEDERLSAFGLLKFLFDKAAPGEKIYSFMKLHAVPHDYRSLVCQVAASLGKTVKQDRHEIFNTVVLFPPRHLDYLHSYIKQVIAKYNYTTDEQIFALLGNLSSIPSDDMEEICKLAFSFFEQPKRVDGIMYNSLLYTLIFTPKQDAAEIIKFIQPLIKELDSGYDQIKILQAFRAIPPKQRDHVLQSAKFIMAKIKYSGNEQAALYTILGSIPPEHRDNFCKVAAPLLENIQQGSHANAILEALRTFPVGQMADLPKLLAPYFKEIDNKWLCAEMLKALRYFSQEERAKTIDLAFSLTSLGSGATGLAPAILKALRSIPEEDREEIVQIAKEKFASELLKGKLPDIFSALALIPSVQRSREHRCHCNPYKIESGNLPLHSRHPALCRSK